ncbi:MAG: Xaa-Pro peptidase family protein [Candidatus Methanomethylicia archaeon]|nr:Xaa-Pro peptidase family protein [Candidatus Methanomethylicia archaeon]
MIDIFLERVKRIIKKLEGEDIDGLLIFPGVNLYYFTGVNIGLSERLTAVYIPVDGEAFILVPKLEEELRGQKTWINRIEVWDEDEDAIEILFKLIVECKLNFGIIGLCEDAPWGWVNKLQSKLSNVHFVDVSNMVYNMRMIKSSWELDNIKKACEIVDKAVEIVFQSLSEGISELELSYICSSKMREFGGVPQFSTVLFKAKSSLPHGYSGDSKLKKGDVVLLDAGCTFNGYFSDITRTIVYGEPNEKQYRVWDIVYRASRNAIVNIKPGIACEDVDFFARSIIESEGFGKYFIHRLGHGIGLQVHEHPYIVKGNRLELKPGMVFTIEPGIYLKGEFGIRIEDVVVCTENGYRILTNFKRSITP